jgi:hypothetical protein
MLEALILAQNKIYPHKIDLGKIWHDKTSLPFVFAVWAMRAEFCRSNPEVVRDIHHELMRCRQEGRKDLQSAAGKKAGRICKISAKEWGQGFQWMLMPVMIICVVLNMISVLKKRKGLFVLLNI